jgi:hypothetical protein
MFIDYKTTVWERFEIDDVFFIDLVLEFLKENPEASAMDIYTWYCDNGGDPHCETIEGTSEEMSVEENGGSSTLEILSSDGSEMIYQNGK